MAYVIVETCACDMECVEVCPTDSIHPRKEEWPAAGYKKGALEGKQLYINPEECIECGACEPVCPKQAIFPSDEVPEKWEKYIKINADYYAT